MGSSMTNKVLCLQMLAIFAYVFGGEESTTKKLQIFTNFSTTTAGISDVTQGDASNVTLASVTLSTITETTCINCTTQSPIQDTTNTPVFINVTTPVPQNTTKRIEQKAVKKTRQYDTSMDICSCDLELHFCTINCCCDKDCTSDDKKIFSHCTTDRNIHYDTRYCDYMQYIYLNNTPLKWEVNQNGLFCIVKSNVPKSYTVQRKHPLKSILEANEEKSRHLFWNMETQSLNYEGEFSSAKLFYYGSPVWIVRKNEGIRKFKLPRALVTRRCVTEEAILNLIDTRSICSQSDFSSENKKLDFGHYFQNFTVIAAPHLVYSLKLNNSLFEGCPKNICLLLEPKLCDSNMKNCRSLLKNSSELVHYCSYDIYHNINTCKNVVEKIIYNFIFNGTQGFKKVEILAVLKNVSYTFSKDEFEIEQEFSVNYFWPKQGRNFSEILSGNPGYIVSKPILIGEKITSENHTMIQRNHSEFLLNFLVLPKNIGGKCYLNESLNMPVEFGFNMLVKCSLNAKIWLKQNFNATEICRNLQRTIFEYWSLKNYNTTVIGTFGNSNVEDLTDWISILFKVSPVTFLNSTSGNFTKDNSSLVCFNMTTVVNIDIFHARVDFESVLNQEKILGVIYDFTKMKNITFPLDITRKLLDFDVHLNHFVTFYDITKQKHRKYVDPPSLEIKLPYDFFYPFIKIDSSVARVTGPNSFFPIICGIVLINKMYF